MAVFYLFLLGATFVGIAMRRRPFVQTQMVIAAMACVVVFCFYFLGMI